MGPDGHTASLFPGNAALAETRPLGGAVNYVPKFAADRMTLTLPILNRAREVLFLVAGADKAERACRGAGGPAGRQRNCRRRWSGRRRASSTGIVDRGWPRRRLRKSNSTPHAVKLAPSILAADFARLGEQVREAEQAGADRIHVDVMDGHFVPNLSMGPVVVKALRPVTDLPLEVHLMIADPDRYIDAFVRGRGRHADRPRRERGDLHRTIQHVKHLGKKAGVVLNPATSA